jgi:glycosyltransferase involved in cell wall biosynthesis
MRIAYLNPSGSMGGAETSLVSLLSGIREAEPDWRLTLVLGEEGPLRRNAEALGVEVVIVAFPKPLARLGDAGRRQPLWFHAFAVFRASLAIARYAGRMAALLRDLRPDLIHTNGFKMHVIGAWARPPRTPVLWHVHDYVRSRPVMGKALRWRRGRCAAAVVNSGSVAEDVRAALGSRVPVVTLYNAIDLQRFSPAGAILDLDRLSGMEPGGTGIIRIGLVATFARWKGHKVFLEALSLLPPSLPVRGYIIGGPIYQTAGSQFSLEELRDEAARLKISHKVGLTGFVDDAAAAMRALDIVVHASTQPEPFGMVIIEGMACEKAVIASEGGGASELFVEGQNAVGHQPGDAAALALQMERLASDEALRRRLGKAGRETTEQLFSRGRLANELLAVYQDVFRRSGRYPEYRAPIEPAPPASPLTRTR